MPGEGDLETRWGGKKGRSCLALGGSKLRAQSELGQGLETLVREKGGTTEEGLGRSPGEAGGGECLVTPGVGEDLPPAGLRHGPWGRIRPRGERLGAVWGRGLRCAAQQLTGRSHFACAGSQPLLCLAAPCLGTGPASGDRGWLCPTLGPWGWKNPTCWDRVAAPSTRSPLCTLALQPPHPTAHAGTCQCLQPCTGPGAPWGLPWGQGLEVAWTQASISRIA